MRHLHHRRCSGHGGSKVRPPAWVAAEWVAQGSFVAPVLTADLSLGGQDVLSSQPGRSAHATLAIAAILAFAWEELTRPHSWQTISCIWNLECRPPACGVRNARSFPGLDVRISWGRLVLTLNKDRRSLPLISAQASTLSATTNICWDKREVRWQERVFSEGKRES